MTFGGAISHNIRNCVSFSGRDPRSAFWWYVLFYFLGSLVANAIDGVLFLVQASALLENFEEPQDLFTELFSSPWVYFRMAPVSFIWLLVNLVPLFSCGIRRRHDCDKKGVIFALICVVGMATSIIALVYVFSVFEQMGEFMQTELQNPGAGVSPFLDEQSIEDLMRQMSMFTILSGVQMLAGIAIIVMMATRGTIGPNQYGMDPVT